MGLKTNQVLNTIKLLEEGGTVPFISRYRKEMTEGLDEVQITGVRDRLEQLQELDKRKAAILKSIESQGKLNDDLREKIKRAETMTVLEDIYLPYKPKRKTRATVAREKGLEPLAKLIFEQRINDVENEAKSYIDPSKDVKDVEQAVQGARDIIAEWINEDAIVRSKIRKLFVQESTITSKVIRGKEMEGEKYKDYFEWDEPLAKTPSHRLLAMRRGEKEGILSLNIKPDESEALQVIKDLVIKGAGRSSDKVEEAAEDAYKRLLKPSMETEARLQSRTLADEEAIKVFAENLKELLMASPLGQKYVLAIDPGFRTGCKVVVLDRQGKLLHNHTIYPNEPQNRKEESQLVIEKMVADYGVEAIAIGNGTASRETEAFVRGLEVNSDIIIEMVNESGASI